MILAIVTTAIISAAITSLVMYVKIVKPLGQYAQFCKLDEEHTHTELMYYKSLLADVTAWIEIQVNPLVARAIRQRIKERL